MVRAPRRPIIIPRTSSALGTFINLTAYTMLNMTVLEFERALTGPRGPTVQALLILTRPSVLIMLPIPPIIMY